MIPAFNNFAKHRHRGFDFIITTQAPSQLASFFRELLGRHIHVTRKFGTQTTIRYEWPHVQESPNGQTAKSNAQEQVWQYPKEVFALYESATLHTVKRKIPKKIILALVMGVLGAVVLPLALAYQVSTLTPDELENSATEPAEQQTGAHSEASTPVMLDGEEVISSQDYAFLRTPRIAADPASAPLYDRFEVQDYPRMFCVISGDQRIERISCRCRTQQMTPVLVDDRVCIHAARFGVWDPRLKPVGYAPREADQPMPESLQQVTEPLASGPVGIGRGIDRSTLQPYTPPDFTSR
jgi:zona occludens toxin